MDRFHQETCILAGTVEENTRRLALEIAHCPVVTAVLRGESSDCRDVINFQKKRPTSERWVPEPWSGHVERAPILFLSSNPSAGDPEAPPIAGDVTASSDDETLLHLFDDAFDEGPWIGIHEGTHLRAADGEVGDYIAYWGSCKARASELLGRPARPGVDYALTEVVHCGSKHEAGVWPASTECVPRYLTRVLGLSPAVVIAVVGSVARDVVRRMVPALGANSHNAVPMEWAGRRRHVLFLPHPNARGVPKGVVAYLGGDFAADALPAIRTAARAGELSAPA
jgi:hypothetical protein